MLIIAKKIANDDSDKLLTKQKYFELRAAGDEKFNQLSNYGVYSGHFYAIIGVVVEVM
jgi:hypothetical protein